MQTAIIGLPQVGKTSLFTILTGAASEGRVGSTKLQIGVAKVPDKRVDAFNSYLTNEPFVTGTGEFTTRDVPVLAAAGPKGHERVARSHANGAVPTVRRRW